MECPLLSEFSQSIERERNGYRLKQRQTIDKNLETTFEFFSNPENLERLTPDRLQFNVLNCEPLPVTEGTTIQYKLKIWGIPARWTSVITKWDPPHEFRDVMERGPYSTWEHTHRFESDGDLTVVIDDVYYELPMGFAGRVLGGWIVEWDIGSIFRHRAEQLDTVFSSNPTT